MRFVGGYPAVDFLAFLVGDNQLGTRQFFVCGDVYLGDFHLDNIVPHLKPLHLAGGQNRKRYTLGKGIPVRGFHFGQRVITCEQLFDVVRLVGGCPAVNLLAVLVGNGQFRAGQFLHCGQIFLRNFPLNDIVPHFKPLHLAGGQHRKRYAFGKGISVRGFHLGQRVIACG